MCEELSLEEVVFSFSLSVCLFVSLCICRCVCCNKEEVEVETGREEYQLRVCSRFQLLLLLN